MTSSSGSKGKVGAAVRPLAAATLVDVNAPHGTVSVGCALPGDLALYRSDGSLIDRLVDRASGGLGFVHVEVIVQGQAPDGNPMSVGALGGGVTRHPLPITDTLAVVPVSTRLGEHGRFVALDWLAAQLGAPYSFLDIAADALGFVLPKALGSRTPFLVAPRSYDCSELAVRFLQHALVPWLPDAMIDDPARVSPNDLAHLFALA